MRNIFIIASAIFIFASCSNEKEKAEKKVKYSDLTIENLKGDVTTIEETPYKVDSVGKIGEMDSCCIDKWEYDENGNYIKSVSRDSKGAITKDDVAVRHENGLWKGSKATKEGRPSGSMDTRIDDNGIYVSAEAFDSTGKLEYYYTGITQNEFGQVLGWKQYDKDSVYRMEGKNKYEKNLFMGFTAIDSVGITKSKSSAKYNDKGEQIEFTNTTITKDSTTTKVTKYTYEAHDENGNWTQRTEWDEKGKPVKMVKRIYTYRKEDAKK